MREKITVYKQSNTENNCNNKRVCMQIIQPIHTHTHKHTRTVKEIIDDVNNVHGIEK